MRPSRGLREKNGTEVKVISKNVDETRSTRLHPRDPAVLLGQLRARRAQSFRHRTPRLLRQQRLEHLARLRAPRVAREIHPSQKRTSSGHASLTARRAASTRGGPPPRTCTSPPASSPATIAPSSGSACSSPPPSANADTIASTTPSSPDRRSARRGDGGGVSPVPALHHRPSPLVRRWLVLGVRDLPGRASPRLTLAVVYRSLALASITGVGFPSPPRRITRSCPTTPRP
jgi:hypothetical protein